jgi:alpha-mannosidase
VAGKLNIHLVPHTHDDTGWLITVDQYYYREVQYIIETVVTRLLMNPDRKFIYVETAFFARWWYEQTPERQDEVKKLVARGQLEFINGGWCMHDEASPHYVQMVDQTTRGHQFLMRHFGIRPSVTWQIDPFGHSNTEAWLLGAEAGMDALFFGRMDYQDFAVRKNTSRTEWIWQGSKSMGASAQTFTGELYGGGGGGYGPPCCSFNGGDSQIQDDPRQHDYNVDGWIDQVVSHANDQAAHTETNHIMWAMGTDFNYQNAETWYNNLDKLIHYTNQNATVNMFYSTPSIYVKAKRASSVNWEVREDDIFPLADGAHHYWSGYFTSRSALKFWERIGAGYMNAARQFETLDDVTMKTDMLEAAVGVATHHDGMSGSSKQAVADDYMERIADGQGYASDFVAKSLAKRLTGATSVQQCRALNMTFCRYTTETDSFAVTIWNQLAQAKEELVRLPIGSSSATVTMNGAAVAAQVDPISARDLALPLLYLTFQEQQNKTKVDETSNKATHVLSFVATLPPMGFVSYEVKQGSGPAASTSTAPQRSEASASTTLTSKSISNGMYEIQFDEASGTLTSLKNLKTGVMTPFSIEVGFYNSSTGGCTDGLIPKPAGGYPAKSYVCDKQKSGAYMFRPNSSNVFSVNPGVKPTLSVSEGPLVTSLTIAASSWATLVLRLTKNMPYVEVEWTVGPIPQVGSAWPDVDGHIKPMGKEVIVKYVSGLKTKNANGAPVVYTDSNAREMVKRVYNARGPSYPTLNVTEPVAGNYYPVNALIAVTDEVAKEELAVLVDRSMGGASLSSGEIELMVHRRVLEDDSRGVAEPLNETMCGCTACDCEGLTLKGRHFVVLDNIDGAHEARRLLSEELSFPSVVGFSKEGSSGATFSAISKALPKNVKLMTLKNMPAEDVAYTKGHVLVRLAHLFQVDEHSTLAKPVNVSLASLFSTSALKITSATEWSLTVNRNAQEMMEAELERGTWKTDQTTQVLHAAARTKRVYLDSADPSLSVLIHPMEVRTFVCDFTRSESPQKLERTM